MPSFASSTAARKQGAAVSEVALGVGRRHEAPQLDHRENAAAPAKGSKTAAGARRRSGLRPNRCLRHDASFEEWETRGSPAATPTRSGRGRRRRVNLTTFNDASAKETTTP